MTAHEAEKLTTPGGREVPVDSVLVPLIRALWEAGFTTIGCCQDLGESIGSANPRKAAYWKGWVLLEMPERDACLLSELAVASGRFPLHWAEAGAWEMSSPLVQLPTGTLRPDLVQVRFPAGQLEDLEAMVRACRPGQKEQT
jgi:hypothetical protein